MATLNHTKYYRTLRDQFDRQRGGSKLSGGGTERTIDSKDFAESSAVAASAKLPPFWVDSVQDVEVLVKEIEQKITQLDEAHKARLLVSGFRDDDTDSARDKEIDTLTNNITKKFREAEGRVKLIGTVKGQPQTGGEDEAVRINIQKSMATKLQQLSLSFRKSQKQYLSRLKAQKNGGKASIFLDDDEVCFFCKHGDREPMQIYM